MTVTSALTHALAGLNVSARRADTVATNIANAGTAGYVRRELGVGARVLGDATSGPLVTGVRRNQDAALLSDTRRAGAEAGGADILAQASTAIETAIGTPQDETSLTGLIDSLENRLIAAAGDPASATRLQAVMAAADDVVDHFARVSGQIQDLRQQADTAIASGVGSINAALAGIEKLNIEIQAGSMAGRDTSGLFDQRQALVDQIATLIPLRELGRDHGQIALYSAGGAVLIDGRAATLGFDPAHAITADQTALSGLTVNGHDLPQSQIAGGALAADFTLRDSLAPQAQAGLDAIALELVARLSDPAVDPSANGVGVFTDAGGAVTGEQGLSARLSLNPALAGATWRLRDGLGASAAGAAGQSTLLTDLQQALAAVQTPASPQSGSAPRSVSGLAAELTASLSQNRILAEDRATQSTARADALQKMQDEAGVDTDTELQDLLVIERAYTANAKVIQTVDQMIETLLGF